MTLPSFNAEQSLYRSSRHYRASALASAVGRIRPSNAPVPPPGSYQRTCFDISYEPDGTTLCATCYDEHGFISGSCLDGAFWCPTTMGMTSSTAMERWSVLSVHNATAL